MTTSFTLSTDEWEDDYTPDKKRKFTFYFKSLLNQFRSPLLSDGKKKTMNKIIFPIEKERPMVYEISIDCMDEGGLVGVVFSQITIKQTVVEDANAGLDVLDGLMGLLEAGDLNVINSFAKSSENLLVDGMTAKDIARLQQLMSGADMPCVARDCNNGGKDGNTSKCSTTAGKHCDCAVGFSGFTCTWNEAAKLKASNMVKDALKPMKAAESLIDGQKQGMESMESLGKDPNMVNKESTDSQYKNLDKMKGAAITGHYSTVGISVLGTGVSSEKSANKAKAPSKDEEKLQNEKMMAASDDILTGSVVEDAGEGVVVETQLVQANKKTVMAGADASVKSSSGGANIPASVLGRLLADNGAGDGSSCDMLNFKNEVYSDNDEIKESGNSDTMALNLVDENGNKMKVESDQGIMLTISLGDCENLDPTIEQKCTQFDEDLQKPSDLGLVAMDVDPIACVVHCKATHMTNFFGSLAKKLGNKFGNANWGLFGGSAFHKPLWENCGFIQVFCFIWCWIIGMMLCIWADLPRFANQTDNEILADALKWTDRKYGKELRDSGQLNRKNPTRTESLFVLVRRYLGRKRQDKQLEQMADFASCVHSQFELNSKKLTTKTAKGITENIYKKHFKKRIKKRNFDVQEGAKSRVKGQEGEYDQDAADYPFWKEDDFENIEEKTWVEKVLPIAQFFVNTLLNNHAVINLIRESARMFPKHSKFNMLAVTLMQLSFVNCLFYQGQGAPGCGNPSIIDKIQDSIVNVVVAIVFNMPIMTFISGKLRVPEKQRKAVQKAPISLKVVVWKSFEPIINARFAVGYAASIFWMLMCSWVIYNFGNMVSWETNLKLLTTITCSYTYDIMVSEVINTGFTTILETIRRIVTGDTKRYLTNVMILRLIAKEMKNMG